MTPASSASDSQVIVRPSKPFLYIIIYPPRYDEACLPLIDKDYLSIEDEFDSTSDSDPDNLCDSSEDEADTASDTGSESHLEEIDNSIDNDDDDLSDSEVRHPPEYYIAASANLDVGRLRQKRYSPKTQDRLDLGFRELR